MPSYFFLLSTIYTVIITIGFIIKWKRKKNKINKKSLILYFLGAYFVSSMFFLFLSISSTFIIGYFKPQYYAKVVRYIGNSDSESESSICVVRFTDSNKIIQEKRFNYSSSINPSIGDTITIGYSNGDENIYNTDINTTWLPLAGISVFTILFGILAIAIALRAFNKSNYYLVKFIIYTLCYLIFPGAMLFFIIVLSWAIWEYFQGRKELPIWTLVICSILLTGIILGFWGYIVSLIRNAKNKII